MLLTGLLSACQPTYKEINYGSDICHHCKMTIVDKLHAAELVTTKSKVYKFDAIECMAQYISDKSEADFAFFLVNDFNDPGKLIDAKEATFLISKAIPSPMGAFLSAFSASDLAEKMKMEKGGEIFNWESIKQQFK